MRFFALALGWPALLALLLISVSCSAGSPADPAGLPADSGELSWPPNENVLRSISDDQVTVQGDDFSAEGGVTAVSGSDLEMQGGTELSYGIYSMGGFDEDMTIGTIIANFSVQVNEPFDAPQVWFAIANYATERWQFAAADAGGWSFPVASPLNYHSPAGNVHVALIVQDPGGVTIDNVIFSRIGNIGQPDAPENLVGVQNVGQIDLDWDDVPEATGYNIYRSLQPDFSAPVKVNATPVTESEYSNSDIATHRIFYYCVTAVDLLESGYSNQIDIFSPRADLPFPVNVQFSDSTVTSVKVTWEWEGANPGGWQLYFKSGKDFNLDPPITQKQVAPFVRQYTFNEVEPGEQLFFRIAARTSGGDIGRMIDDIPLLADDLWEWGPIEEIGAGSGPMEAITADGDLSVAFLNASDILLARRNAGSWGSDVALGDNGESYFRYLDVGYANGKYIVGGYTQGSDDLWASTGTPGSWSMELVDGDGSKALIHPAEGDSLRVAASEIEFAIVYQLGEQSSAPKTLSLATRGLSGGAWTKEVIYNDEEVHAFNEHSVTYDGEDLLVLNNVPLNGELLFGRRATNWQWENIFGASNPGLGSNNRILRSGTDLFTTAYTAATQKLFVYRDNVDPWSAEQISFNALPAGREATLVNNNGLPVALFYGENPDQWYFSIFDGADWTTQWISIPGAQFTGYGDLCILGGELYFVYFDEADGLFKCAKGTPPA